MFVAEPDRGTLHQGDVFSPMMFPKWDVNTYKLSGTHRLGLLDGATLEVLAYQDLEPDQLGAGVRKPEPIRVMLCSQGCEIDKVSGRLGLLVAPILEPDHMSAEEEAKFRSSFTHSREGKLEYIEQFPVEIDGRLWSVRFSGIMAIGSPKAVVPWLRDRKEYQLTNEFRRHLRLKLGQYFGRAEED